MKNRYCNPETKKWVTFKQLLNSAFKTFDKVGIVAKQDFACCLICGNDEIVDHFKVDSIGYTFYHTQDVESLKRDTVYLAYSSWDGNYKKSKHVGFVIKKHLESYGLKIDWDENPSHRIKVYKKQHVSL